jgi:hypothetical protein
MGDMRNTNKILARNLGRKRLFRSSGCRWENNIKMEGMDSIDWAQR